MEEKPTFIKIDKYEAVTATLAVIKKKLNEARTTLDKINGIKQEEDAAVQKWASELDAVQTKIEGIETELNEQ